MYVRTCAYGRSVSAPRRLSSTDRLRDIASFIYPSCRRPAKAQQRLLAVPHVGTNAIAKLVREDLTLERRLHAAVAAFWPGPDDSPEVEPWATLRQGLGSYSENRLDSLVVLGDPSCRPQGSLIRRDGLATVLGYVSTRDGNIDGPLCSPETMEGRIQEWLSDPNLSPDGIYLDEAVTAADETGAQNLVAFFHDHHPDLRLMVLAGGCRDPWVVEGFDGASGYVAPPDWVLLWETDVWAYRETYGAQKLAAPPAGQDPTSNDTSLVTMPSWWVDPAHRQRIVHTVHDTASDYDWQDVTGRAVQRNVGHLYVMDWRDRDHQGRHSAYAHLPPYFVDQCRWADSYNELSRGLSDLELVQAARSVGVARGALHAWPNFEQATYGQGQVRGTWFLDDTPEARAVVDIVKIPSDELLDINGIPASSSDLPTMWGATHRWAVGAGYVTAMLMWSPPNADGWEAFGFKQVDWLKVGKFMAMARPTKIDVSTHPPQAVPWQQLEGRYTFAEAGSVVRQISRAVTDIPMAATGWPTFSAAVRDADTGGDPTGRKMVTGQDGYEAVLLLDGAPVHWEDIPAQEYVLALNPS